MPLADNILNTGRPKPYVPMMVPARLTNNARCQIDAAEGDYCNSLTDEAYGLVDQCVGTVQIPLGPQGNPQDICVVDANKSGTLDAGDLPNVANTAASRPRLNLRPRDTDGDGITDDAWVIIIHEEDKGLGRFGFLNDEAYTNVDTVATSCGDPDADQTDNCDRADIGKNQWYISFALGTPQTSVLDGTAASDVDYSLLNSLVAQHNMYNAPEVNWITGTFYPPMSTADMWNFDANGTDLNFSIFNTEIARRASLMSQPLGKALAAAETNDTGEVIMAMPLFKEGTINQGGPADIMARRITIFNELGGCEGFIPGPGPGGVQPTLEEAVWTYDEATDTYTLAVSGFICVDGNSDPQDVILELFDALEPTTGDPLCEFDRDNTALVQVGEDYTFEASCEVPLDLQPCDVYVVTGPGWTQGGGQVSDTIEVVDDEGEPVCDECTIQVDADVPTIDYAQYFLLSSGNGRIELSVDGLDGDLATAVTTRNAVTEEILVNRIYDEDAPWTETSEDFVYRIAVGPGSTRPIPCAVQVADFDGNLEFGPWIPVAGAPEDCRGPIPPSCQ